MAVFMRTADFAASAFALTAKLIRQVHGGKNGGTVISILVDVRHVRHTHNCTTPALFILKVYQLYQLLSTLYTVPVHVKLANGLLDCRLKTG